MTDNTDETAKALTRPSDAPRRPHATIDLKASEIRAEGGGSAAAGHRDNVGAATAHRPPPSVEEERGEARGRRTWLRALGSRAWMMLMMLMAALAGAGAWALRLARNGAFLSHVAAGMVGAALTLITAIFWGLPTGAPAVDTADQARRLAAAETTLAQQAASLPANGAIRLAAAEQRLARIEEQAKAIASLREAQARLAAEAKARGGMPPPAVMDRIAKLESALATVASERKAGNAPSEQLVARLTAVEERLSVQAGKLAAAEHELQANRKSEKERIGGAQQSLLALQLADLKRALDRGDSFASELDAAKKAAAGGTIDLSGLDHAAASGVPTLQALAQDFRRVADAAVDGEADDPNASALDRLLAGARSVVRVRKTSYDPGDTSLEATLWRMEKALANGDIGEVLAQGKRLPPKAARSAEDWLRKLEARHAADRTVAEAEAVLRASLARQLPAAEPTR
ncbi:MAG TPA: hypothetical protein VFZ16_10490 [Hyphomicrobiaceae bacterium]|nr:hypothetical protein [Hyphomicrobiaceae bacterium]